jgi:putative ABC transport system substrate-binding protein
MKLTGAALLMSLGLSLAAPLADGAQYTAGKVPRIGWLGSLSPSAVPHLREAFRQGLCDLGYVEGQNIGIELRFAEGRTEWLPDLAAELVALKVDVLVAAGTPAALAAKQATTTIPTVFVAVGDAVGSGLAASLARPGGNMTGLALLTPEVNEKRLELLKETLPGASRVAILLNPGNRSHEQQVRDLAVAARALGVQLQPVEVQSPDDFEGAFATMSRQNAGAVIVLPSAIHHNHLRRIADLAVRSRLPGMCEFLEFVGEGGLMGYGPSWADLHRRVATYVDKILRGAKPADLPIEQPTTFRLVVNLKTAKALGLTIPPSVLARADEVIQ